MPLRHSVPTGTRNAENAENAEFAETLPRALGRVSARSAFSANSALNDRATSQNRGFLFRAYSVAPRASIACPACRPSIARRNFSFASGVISSENVSMFMEQSDPHMVQTPFS